MTNPARAECVDCARLPKLPATEADVDEDVEYRPVRPRGVVAGNGPRSWRCATHQRAHEQAAKQSAHDARVARTFGLQRGEYEALYRFQGERCAVCRRATGAARRLAVDHDHELARLHDHPEDRGCPDCIRSLLCATCNQVVLGRYDAEALQRAIDVLNDPPYQRMRRGEAS